MRTAMLTLVLLAGCAGSAKSVEQLRQLDNRMLLDEACSPAARVPSYLNYDSTYRPRVIAELAKRHGWSDREQSVILQQGIKMGMTQSQIVASRGWPNSITTNTSALGTNETWHYGGIGSGLWIVVHFTDGVCASWTQYR